MHVTFYGAAREVTGSMHLLTSEKDRILLDCGLYQGRRKETAEKNRVLPFDPAILTNIILSHAHIDHSGRIPLLTRNNFTGRVICTRITQDASGYLLPDSAHIQESDANYLNYKLLRSALNNENFRNKGKNKDLKKVLKKNHHALDVEAINQLMEKLHLEKISPLYTSIDAEQALTYFDSYPYRTPITIGDEITCTFYEAGHILGSAISILTVKENGRTYKIGFTGDIGRFDKPILKDPCLNFAEDHRDLDLLIMESTYGDRLHEPTRDLKGSLIDILLENQKKQGSILIPSFAFGRTQELLYILNEIYKEGAAPKLPIFVDSPLATNITRVFGEHPEAYDEETHNTFLKAGLNPFTSDNVHFVGSVEESMALMRENRQQIIISASGMCEAGRILHHLRYKIHDSKNTILIVGYMAQNTLGRRILEQGSAYQKKGGEGPAPLLKFLNKEYPLKATVKKLGGFSAHADKKEMLRFLNQSNLNIKKIAVVHGEEEQSLAFARHLENEGYTAKVPRCGDIISIK